MVLLRFRRFYPLIKFCKTSFHGSVDFYSVPLGKELHMSGTADLRIDTKDDLFTSGEVLRKLHLSSFGVDSIAKFCLGILIGSPEQCHIAHPEALCLLFYLV